MADVIRIKRRVAPGSAGAPASLQNAELAYNEQDHTLYIGEGTGGAGGSATVIRAIAGDGLIANLQPLDPDLTSLAAASGTNVMYYRGVGGAWSVVTIGTGLSFSAGTLSTTLGGGNVNSAGTPVANQLAQWTNATTIQGVNQGALYINGFAAPSADWSNGGFRHTNLADPIAQQDAATKNYVDNVASGIDAKQSVRLTSNVQTTLSGTQTVDGFSTVAGDRILLWGQTAPAQNGVYVASAGSWIRAGDLNTWNSLVSAYVWVEEGVTFADTGFVCTVNAGGTLGTTAVTWAQFSGAAQITAGAGMTKSGNTLDVVGTTNRITVAADSIDIAVTYVGQTSITTLGTITTGVWQGTPINPGYIAGLGSMATQAASAVAITGGTIDNITLDGGTF